MARIDKDDRIAALEDQLRQRDRRITELKRDLDEAEQLSEQRREWVEDDIAMREQWIEAFEMVEDADGELTWSPFVEAHDKLHADYVELVREWNKHIGEFNEMYGMRQPPGRPLEASETQVGEVERMHEAGLSLRATVKATGLTLSTVRTIVDKLKGGDRTTRKRQELRRRELNRHRQAAWRARKRTRDGLPKQLTGLLARGRELAKRAR